MTQLVRYDAMVSAIAECHSVDEVKEIHDKALAIDLYARQSKNTDAERKAADIRLRAERRCGDLLRELERATPAERANNANATMGRSSDGATNVSEYAATLERVGLSRQTAHRWQELAAVPAETFERHLGGLGRKPSTAAILEAEKPSEPAIDNASLVIWSRAREFEREDFASRTPESVLAGMSDAMRADLVRILPSMLDMLSALMKLTKHQ